MNDSEFYTNLFWLFGFSCFAFGITVTALYYETRSKKEW